MGHLDMQLTSLPFRWSSYPGLRNISMPVIGSSLGGQVLADCTRTISLPEFRRFIGEWPMSAM
jgi:hypothetical protein